MRLKLTPLIFGGMALGIATGVGVHLWAGGDAAAAARIADYLQLPADVFLRLIKMIVAPLVFATLVTGIAHMGDVASLGRMGARAMGWFVTAGLVSLSLGLLFVNAFAPGEALHLVRTADPGGMAEKALSFRQFVLHIFPESVVQAMAENQILQIVVFSLFVGVALSAAGERGKPLLAVVEATADLMLTITGYVMRAAPLAVFGAIAATVATQGAGILLTFGALIAEFYVALAALCLVLLGAGAAFLGGGLAPLLRHVREPLLLAFSTASSEAAYPRLMEALDRAGVPRRVYGFVLPLGYSFNLDGSMMYATFAAIFIAQAYGVDLPIATQITMLLVLMVTSKGIAGVSRASLVVVAATLAQFDLPVEGVALLLAIDHFMDMGRTTTNVLGNAIATAVVAKWESADRPRPLITESGRL
ncbi:dicarboxylate/amino acid:cation symporter [Sphingomonas sp. YL-JM2C]